MASDAYSAQVLADGPVGYWRLGEPEGSMTAADSSQNGNDGASSGGVTFGLSPSPLPEGDTAALFDGVTGRITVPNSQELNPTRITMEALVRWDGETGLQQRILEKESWVGITQYGLSVLPDGRVHVELRRRAAPPPTVPLMEANSTEPVALGAETYVAATYDGLAIAIYLDGSLPSTTVVNASPEDIDVKPPPPVDPALDLAIGDRIGITGGRQRTFNGLIDEVALYDAALPADRIQAHYEAQAAMAPTTRIQVSATDNELYVLAVADSGLLSSEICHIKSGFNDEVAYTIVPQSILPSGKYTMIMMGINWGGPQAFEVTLTTGGVSTTYSAPANPAVGANWTVAVPIIV